MKRKRTPRSSEWKAMDFSTVVPFERADQSGLRPTRGLKSLWRKALRWYEAQPWSKGVPVSQTFVGLAIDNVVGVFLIAAKRPVGSSKKQLTWIVVGDLPSGGFTVEENPTGAAALEWYCVLMQEWCDAVLNERSLDDVYPVDAAPTRANAKALASRVAFLRKNVIPLFV